jgi:hypothetical protein
VPAPRARGPHKRGSSDHHNSPGLSGRRAVPEHSASFIGRAPPRSMGRALNTACSAALPDRQGLTPVGQPRCNPWTAHRRPRFRPHMTPPPTSCSPATNTRPCRPVPLHHRTRSAAQAGPDPVWQLTQTWACTVVWSGLVCLSVCLSVCLPACLLGGGRGAHERVASRKDGRPAGRRDGMAQWSGRHVGNVISGVAGRWLRSVVVACSLGTTSLLVMTVGGTDPPGVFGAGG